MNIKLRSSIGEQLLSHMAASNGKSNLYRTFFITEDRICYPVKDKDRFQSSEILSVIVSERIIIDENLFAAL